MKRLHISQILAWADSFYDQTGGWPTRNSGGIGRKVPWTWLQVDAALRKGDFALPRGWSLEWLLWKERKVLAAPRRKHPLCESQVLEWAEAHKARTQEWPTKSSGLIHGTSREKWENVDAALSIG